MLCVCVCMRACVRACVCMQFRSCCSEIILIDVFRWRCLNVNAVSILFLQSCSGSGSVLMRDDSALQMCHDYYDLLYNIISLSGITIITITII